MVEESVTVEGKSYARESYGGKVVVVLEEKQKKKAQVG